uniref:Coiled-coil domain containing 191 n=1 Tax=Sphenodon punctatus TaxID=8508 RepID=A0A8D0GB33_SPHPU
MFVSLPLFLLKRVEQASEFAVSQTFYTKKSSYTQRPRSSVLDLETMEQLEDHDEAYAEAQELLNGWMNSKLRLELASDQENDAGDATANLTPPEEPTAGFLKYEKFDDLYGYLEQEMENTTVQDFLQHLLQHEVVECGILEDLRTEEVKEKKKQRDPRITMELRHKQVKENSLRRQKELDLQKQEKALKKSAMSEARQQVQEEDKKKALKARREEEEIRREMVKLRKEMAEKRRIMEEAWKMERRQELGKKQNLAAVGSSHTVPVPLFQEKEKQLKERERRMQELLQQIHRANHKCLQKYFSAWYKLILDCRIKMGKARALADWKCQLKALRAWKDYIWTRKLKAETKKMEIILRDQNRKKQLAAEHHRRWVLRSYLAEWQSWSRAETERRQLQQKKEETRRKMAELLEAASLGKLGAAGSWDVSMTRERENAHNQPVRQGEVNSFPLVSSLLWINHSSKSLPFDLAEFSHQSVDPKQEVGKSTPKLASAFMGHFEHRHAFQQQLIEEQRRQLQEQQEMILELQKNQRLKKAKEEAKQATAVTLALSNPAPKTRKEKQMRGNLSNCKDTVLLRYSGLSNSQGDFMLRTQSQAKRLTNLIHSIRLLCFKAQLKAEKEEYQKKEAAEKQAQLENRQEERRLQKMKELEKQKRMERDHRLQAKAKDHYEKFLLKKQGLEPWKRLREQAQQNMEVAQKHHCSELERKCLRAWFQHVQESLAGKTAQAKELYARLLLRRSFRGWLMVSEGKGFQLTQTTLTMFRAWRQFPALIKEEREKEERREQLRKKVAEILPDFRIRGERRDKRLNRMNPRWQVQLLMGVCIQSLS